MGKSDLRDTMKNIVLERSDEQSESKPTALVFLKNYVINPFRSGLFGFAAFFSILIATKLFSYWIGTYSFFTVDADDVTLSAIGFVLVAIIKFLENFKQNEF